MKLEITESINNVVEVENLTTILEITDFDAGLRQMLEAEQSNTFTATGNIVLTDSDKVILRIDPGGASRDITLPAEGANNHGYLIKNKADVLTELLVVKNDAGGAVGTVYPGGSGWFTSNGTTWESDGLGTTDIATKKLVHWRITPKDASLSVGDEKDIFTIPEELNGFNLVACHAKVDTVSSSGAPIFQLRNKTDAVDMLSTRVTIDEGEKNSYTAATPPVIDTSKDDVATGDELAADYDGVGVGTKGCTYLMAFQKP